MSKDSKKAYSAVEVARLLSKSMHDEFKQFKSIKKVYSPKDAHLQLADAVRKEIELYQEKLVKMRQAEVGEALEKTLKFHSYGMIDDRYKQHEGDHAYTIHEDTQAPTKGRKFALKHNDQGHLSFHSTMGEAKKAATAHSNSKPMAKEVEPLSKPPVSEAQRKAMAAAAHGNSTLDIPKSVGKEFIDADKGGKLPEHKKGEENLNKEHIGFDKLKNKVKGEGYSDESAKKIAAAVGREKYGAKGMAHKAAEAKKAEECMDKNLQGLASDPHTDAQLHHEMMSHKPSKNVFDILKKKTAIPMAMAEKKLEIKQPSEVHTDPKVAGAVLPSDKVTTSPVDDSGSGGVVKKGKALKKSENVFEVLKKSKPFLGGKDPVSRHMTGDAMMSAPKTMQGATGAPKLKMPSQSEHASRADTLNDFMPQGNFSPATAAVKETKHNQAMDLKNTQMPTRQQSKNVFSILKNKQPKVQSLFNNVVPPKKNY